MIISIFTEGSQSLVIPLKLINSQFKKKIKKEKKSRKTNFLWVIRISHSMSF